MHPEALAQLRLAEFGIEADVGACRTVVELGVVDLPCGGEDLVQEDRLAQPGCPTMTSGAQPSCRSFSAACAAAWPRTKSASARVAGGKIPGVEPRFTAQRRSGTPGTSRPVPEAIARQACPRPDIAAATKPSWAGKLL